MSAKTVKACKAAAIPAFLAALAITVMLTDDGGRASSGPAAAIERSLKGL